VAGAAMIWLAFRIKVLGDADEGDRAAKRLFGVSILYLFVLFAVLLIDDRLGALGRDLL
jgi:protoheme IX farnesyltransferase